MFYTYSIEHAVLAPRVGLIRSATNFTSEDRYPSIEVWLDHLFPMELRRFSGIKHDAIMADKVLPAKKVPGFLHVV